MKERQFEHRGVVECIMSHGVIVSVVQETSCAACAAAAMCHSAEKAQKMIEVTTPDANRYSVGQKVVIVGEMGLGLRATLWAYVAPLALLMTVLMVASYVTGSEGIGAVTGLLSLIPYYIGLYLLRNRLQRTFSFRIVSNP